MSDKEGSELLAALFNRMTKKQKISVPQPMCDRISRFMVDNGYRIVFGRWYLQAEPRTSNADADGSAASADTVRRDVGNNLKQGPGASQPEDMPLRSGADGQGEAVEIQRPTAASLPVSNAQHQAEAGRPIA